MVIVATHTPPSNVASYAVLYPRECYGARHAVELEYLVVFATTTELEPRLTDTHTCGHEGTAIVHSGQVVYSIPLLLPVATAGP